MSESDTLRQEHSPDAGVAHAANRRAAEVDFETAVKAAPRIAGKWLSPNPTRRRGTSMNGSR
jgi:hypothetical protein